MFFNTDFLKSEEIYLKLEKVSEGNQEKNYVPAYHFCFKKNLWVYWIWIFWDCKVTGK